MMVQSLALSQARSSFFSRCSEYEFSKASVAELATKPLTFVELDSRTKIHDCDIDYLYSNILYVKDLWLATEQIFCWTKPGVEQFRLRDAFFFYLTVSEKSHIRIRLYSILSRSRKTSD